MSTALAQASLQSYKALSDFNLFLEEPDEVQADIINKVAWILDISKAPKPHRMSIRKQAAVALDCSIKSVYRYEREFKKKNWKGIADGRKAATSGKGLHPKFKSWVAGIYDPHQRNDDGAEVYRVVMDRWNLWRLSGNPKHSIPGYETCPPAEPNTGHPRSWSRDNIARLKPKKVEAALTKQGAKAASKFLPPVLTTRVGSAILSRRLFDDQDLDTLLTDGFLAIAGIDSVTKPVSFNCLDFFTAKHVDHHLRVMHKEVGNDKAAKQRSKSLTGMEFAWFVIKQLQRDGWRTDDLGSEFIFEHGTANTWASQLLMSLGGHHSFQDALETITGGKCFINRSGKFEGPVFAELCFRAQSTGNFKFKTWIESSFRLLRTYMQAFPGPTGSFARINGKEEMYGIKLAENKLLKTITSCSDPAIQEFLVENFRRELLDLPTFAELINSVYRAINMATVHNLEGWKRCGHSIPLWRPNVDCKEWFAQDELPILYPDDEERQLIVRRINANRDALTKVDLMSREHAWQLGMARDKKILQCLPDNMVGLLLPREWATPVKVAENHTFKLTNPLWADTADSYVASWEEKGRRTTLETGMNLLAYHNPFFDGRAQIHTLDGSYVTTLYPTVRATPFSPSEKLEQLKIRSAIKSGHEAHVRARTESVGGKRQEAQRINKDLIDLTREDRRRTKRKAAEETATKETKQHRTHGQAADDAMANVTPDEKADFVFVDDLDV